ncbi:MAG: toll/interleukin-1 receptor domain-containing protein [Nitrospira sp.]|nr:toll/interleukin-1 receptor domain-containing protein [Nitrospira sp.]
MNEIFISYKREDETRVGPLVQALEGTGLSVWWDRGLPGGESWRQQIQTALDAAKCVIVVWTEASVGPAGDFVRDEAGQAKRRGLLVPVLMDRVSPPLGFGELQAIDLTRWKGRSRDPFFEDLIAAVTAKLEGRPVPPAKGPMKRLVRRLTWSSVVSTVGFGGLALAFNLFSAQDQVCALPLIQPQLSDLCGSLGVGHRPTKAERVAWDQCDGSCDALRRHIEQFPDGAYRTQAAERLAARRVTQTEVWTPGTRRLALFVGQDGAPARTEAEARSAAVARAHPDAERLCKGFTATTTFRLKETTPVAQQWQCEANADGVICGFDGEAVCNMEERRLEETETCGK